MCVCVCVCVRACMRARMQVLGCILLFAAPWNISYYLLSYKDLCFVNQSQGLLKVDGNLELRVKWIWT